jgi:predicted RNA-binding Zn ribbon-like protein
VRDEQRRDQRTADGGAARPLQRQHRERYPRALVGKAHEPRDDDVVAQAGGPTAGRAPPRRGCSPAAQVGGLRCHGTSSTPYVTVQTGDDTSLADAFVTCKDGDVREFDFVAGNVALDFVATVGERTSTAVERLPTTADLADWTVLAGLLDRPPRVTRADLAAARDLREALHELVVALTSGDRLPAAALARVNAAAARAPVTARLDDDGVHRSGDVPAVLSEVARAFVHLAAGPDRTLIRWCADHACTRPFLDRSRGGRRRWCGMAGCGDRAKAAAYRERRRREAVGVMPPPRP